ncbi:MAG TPA: hypothetical protein DG761_05685 [Gammaproteobacteria bacterium]|nr:hypothetical protein [Acidiferrobacteraceae bacterium]MDP6398579.1 hypothetical protein [Arenicellales bacterium]HCX87495.1 hypothetical protein [Gammaproteobacteria bacterium]MDP6552982.1 hypothetical protein [Arenicellales bacterium]MDP6791160.1 hypothetical protein [Arenicellales bacterium]
MNADRFGGLWRRVGGGGEFAGVFEQLSQFYGDASRHYHDGGHIAVCLAAYDNAAAALGTDDAVEMALWFHDVIFVAGARDNEAQSAEWFVSEASGYLPGAFIRGVRALILATDHRDPPQDFQTQFVVDVDLWGLAQPWDAFFADTHDLRREARRSTDEAFARGQGGFLRTLANRQNIYSTAHFQALFEKDAHQNIERLLTLFESGIDWSQA